MLKTCIFVSYKLVSEMVKLFTRMAYRSRASGVKIPKQGIRISSLMQGTECLMVSEFLEKLHKQTFCGMKFDVYCSGPTVIANIL